MEGTSKQRKRANVQKSSSMTIGVMAVFLLAAIFFLIGLYMGARFSTNHALIMTDPSVQHFPVFMEKVALRGAVSSLSYLIDETDPKNLANTINPNSLSQDIFLESSLQATDLSYLSSSFVLNLKKRQLVAAWIYLSPDYSNDNMRTIFSNKMAGCGTDEDRMGIALFVNQWLGDNRELYIEYGDSQSGCNKMQSGSAIEIGKWTHIAGKHSK